MYYVSFPIANIVKWSHQNLDSLNCQTMKVKPYIRLNTSRKHVNYEEDKTKVTMNKPYNIQNTNICRKTNIIHTKLRHRCSGLNADLYRVNLKNDPRCVCGHLFEDAKEDKTKVTMNKPYNIQNTNICNGIFHIAFFKALLQWYFSYFIF
jgi:hypothetical protein